MHFLNRKGKLAAKTGGNKEIQPNPSQATPHLQLHHPSKACEPEQGPVSHPAVQQSSLAQQLHNLLGTRHPASQAQPSTQLTSRPSNQAAKPHLAEPSICLSTEEAGTLHLEMLRHW